MLLAKAKAPYEEFLKINENNSGFDEVRLYP